MRPVLLALMVGSLVVSAAPLAAEPVDPYSARVFAALGARPLNCPDVVLERLEYGQDADCATLDASFGSFKKSWQQFLKNDEVYELAALGGWEGASGEVWRTREYRMGGRQFWVAFSEHNRGLIITYGRQLGMCDSKSEAEVALVFGGTGGVSMPVRLRSNDRTEIPTGAGTLQIGDTQGEAVLKIRVSEHGVPEVLCVLEVYPEGQGYEDAARVMVRRWRYRPARKDGEPVPAAMLVTLTW